MPAQRLHNTCISSARISLHLTRMKVLLVIAAVLAVCYAAPQAGGADPRTATIEEENRVESVAQQPWSWSFRTSNGISRQEQGTIENPGTDDEAISVRGTISWIDANGQPQTLEFIADKNGFQPITNSGVGVARRP